MSAARAGEIHQGWQLSRIQILFIINYQRIKRASLKKRQFKVSPALSRLATLPTSAGPSRSSGGKKEPGQDAQEAEGATRESWPREEVMDSVVAADKKLRDYF